eukprot:1140233-Pelagomonas_calceolata.AAC.2
MNFFPSSTIADTDPACYLKTLFSKIKCIGKQTSEEMIGLASLAHCALHAHTKKTAGEELEVQ